MEEVMVVSEAKVSLAVGSGESSREPSAADADSAYDRYCCLVPLHHTTAHCTDPLMQQY